MVTRDPTNFILSIFYHQREGLDMALQLPTGQKTYSSVGERANFVKTGFRIGEEETPYGIQRGLVAQALISQIEGPYTKSVWKIAYGVLTTASQPAYLRRKPSSQTAKEIILRHANELDRLITARKIRDVSTDDTISRIYNIELRDWHTVSISPELQDLLDRLEFQREAMFFPTPTPIDVTEGWGPEKIVEITFSRAPLRPFAVTEAVDRFLRPQVYHNVAKAIEVSSKGTISPKQVVLRVDVNLADRELMEQIRQSYRGIISRVEEIWGRYSSQFARAQNYVYNKLKGLR